MKKILCFFLMSALAWITFGGTGFVHAQVVNLIANPSLETASGTIPLNWSQSKTGTNTTTFSYLSTGAQNGTRSVRINTTKWTNGEAKWYFNPVSIAGGKQYYFRDYYKASVIAKTYAEFKNASGASTIITLGQNAAKTAWTLSEYIFTAPSDAVSVSVYQALARVGYVQTDNYLLTEVPTPVITDNVPNASFEQEDVKGTPLAWISEKTGTNTSAFSYLATGHTGSRSAMITVSRYTSGDAKWYFTPQTISGESVYTFRDWYKSNVITKVSVRFTLSDKTVSTVALKDAPVSASWANYTDTVTVPLNAVNFTVLHYINKKGTLNVDDYSFKSVPATGTLSVKKVVVNTGGGMKTASDFSFSVNGGSATAFEADGQNDIIAPAGTYSVTEPPAENYSTTYDNCSNIALLAGSSATCTITNTYSAPKGTLTVNSVLIPSTDNGKFNLLIDGVVKTPNAGNNGTTGLVLLSTGAHNVSQTAGTGTILTDYASAISGDCAADGSITLNANDNKTCTITNTLIPKTGILSVKKVVVNTGGGMKTASDFSFSVNGGSATAFEADGQNDIIAPAGTYSVTEPPAENYSTTYDNCSNIALLAGSSATCTITNTFIVPTTVEMVPNPSLEQVNLTGQPQSWFQGGWGTNKPTYTYLDTGHTGSRSVKVSVTGWETGDAKWFFTPVPVTPGTYLFSDYYQSDIPTTLAAQFTDSAGYHYIPLATFPASESWKNAKWYFTVPDGVTHITIFHLISADGWLTIDDLSLTSYTGTIPQPPAPTLANMILNPSLEYADLNGNAIGWLKGGWGTNTAALSIVHPGSTGAGDNAAQVVITEYTGGDAKWYFTPVPVKPNYKYTITDYYQSDVTSYTAVEFQMNDGTTQFYDLTTLNPSTNWKQFTDTFSTPANTKSLTFYHLIKSVGTLRTDNFGLAEGGASQLAQGIVSLNFDNGFLSAYTNATPILTDAGLNATYYIAQNETIANDPSRMTLAQVKTLYDAGDEIGSHSKTHNDMTTMSATQLVGETTGTKTWFTENGMPNVTTFAYPYGAYNDAVETAVKNAGFVAARSTFGGFNDKGTNKYEFKTFIVQNTTTAADIQTQIDYATQNKMWLILLFHEVIDNTDGNQYSTTPAIIQSTADYLKAQNITVMANDQVLPLLAQ